MARLYVLSGADVGRTLDFDAFATIGRIQACDLVLRDTSISRRHAHVQRDGDGWEVVDDDSRNGVTIAGERVQRHALPDGQEFLLGEVLLRFRAEVAAAPAELARPLATPTPTPAPAPPKPTPAADSGLELEDAEVIQLGAQAREDLGRTRVARAMGTPAALGASTRESFRPGSEALAEQRGRILQYHRAAESDSLMAFEFAQLPLWQRALVVLLATALMAGLAWAAFFGSAFLRGKLAPERDANAAETSE
ncbi:MAG TPA: FHA domain-containing protein [Planctomycetota bacterium]|nr:FHA domain-containing protein [Planctomycetota bacterium]